MYQIAINIFLKKSKLIIMARWQVNLQELCLFFSHSRALYVHCDLLLPQSLSRGSKAGNNGFQVLIYPSEFLNGKLIVIL